MKGCEWQGTLDSLNPHIEPQSGSCPFVHLPCSNGCGLDLIRKDNQLHLNNECKLRICSCEHCSFRSPFVHMADHYSTCSDYPVLCKKGCQMTFKRENIHNHEMICPMGKKIMQLNKMYQEIRQVRSDIYKVYPQFQQVKSKLEADIIQIHQSFQKVNSKLEADLYKICQEIYQPYMKLKIDVNQLQQEMCQLKKTVKANINRVHQETDQVIVALNEVWQGLCQVNADLHKVCKKCQQLNIIETDLNKKHQKIWQEANNMFNDVIQEVNEVVYQSKPAFNHMCKELRDLINEVDYELRKFKREAQRDRKISKKLGNRKFKKHRENVEPNEGYLDDIVLLILITIIIFSFVKNIKYYYYYHLL